MRVEELIYTAQELSEQDQLRLVNAIQERRFTKLESDFAKMLGGATEISICTPYGCYEAAAVLEKMLADGKVES